MGRSHLQKGHGNTSQTDLLLRGHLLTEVRLHRRLQNSGIRYEIGEIRYEQCSGTPFYLLKWPFLQSPRPRVPATLPEHPLQSREDAAHRAPSARRRYHPSGGPPQRVE